MTSTLEQIQEAIRDRLLAKNEIASNNIRVLTRRDSEFDTILENEIYTQTGVAIEVLMPLPVRIAPNAPGVIAEEVTVQITVTENVVTNTTGLSALHLATRLMQWLHLWHVADSDGDRIDYCHAALVLRPESPIDEVPAEPNFNELTVNFTTAVQMPSLINSD